MKSERPKRSGVIALLTCLSLAAVGAALASPPVLTSKPRLSTSVLRTNPPMPEKPGGVRSQVTVHPPQTLRGSTNPAQGITYTCDTNFETYGPAGLCAALNSILPPLYSSTFTNANASIYILFDPNAGLGESVQYNNATSYSAYQATLLNESTGTAKAFVPVAEPAIFGTLPVGVTSALARNLGITGATSITAEGGTCSTPGVGDCYDAIVHVVTPAGLLAETNNTQGLSYRSLSGSTNGTTDNYDFFSVVEHETDEVLGTASCVGYSSPTTTGTPNCVSAEDLFRYTSTGTRIFNTFAYSYFSADGGMTDLDDNTYNTTEGAGDWGDFSQICVFVQDAEACDSGTSANYILDITNDGPGGTPGPEIAMLNAVGYNLITGASQTITFAALPNVTYGVGPITLTATASSGLPVTYAVTGPAMLSGSTLTINGAGSITVTASQAGNSSFAPATPVSRTFAVAKAPLTVTANNAARVQGAANPAFTYSITGFVHGDTAAAVSGTATETTTATTASTPGQYPITFSTKNLTATNYTFTYVNGTLTVTPVSSAGSLSGAGNTATTTANLTAEGAADWVHFKFGTLTRKSAVTPLLSNYSVVGSGTVLNYTNDPRALSWTDGTPVVTGSDMNGLYIQSVNNGFSFTAPADTTPRVLTIHVGGWFSGGTLTAHLSDGSANNFVDITPTVSASYDRNYTLTYNAASTGQTLTVSWVMVSGTGNVTLNGAALSQIAPSISATAGSSQSAVVNKQFGTLLQATVKNAQNNPMSGVVVTFTAPSAGPSAVFGSSATATATTNNLGIATASTLTANAQVGSYTVTASAPGVTTTASFSLTNTSASAGASLSGSGNSAATTANLTAEGTTDWVHFKFGTLTRKSGVTPKISNYAVVGSGTVLSYTNDPRALSWTDGTPIVSGSDVNGLYIQSVNNGFSFTAPADTTSRVLTIHVGGWFSGGTLTAHLSDGSAANFVDSPPSISAAYDRNYTLTYKAASTGQTLTISWIMISGTGNVTLNGAALK